MKQHYLHFFLLYFCVTTGLAHQVWKTGWEYQFKVTAEANKPAAAFSKYAAMEQHYIVHVDVVQDDLLNINILDLEFFDVDEATGRKTRVPVPPDVGQMFMAPLYLKMKNNFVEWVQLPKDTPLWIVNAKKVVAQSYNLDLTGVHNELLNKFQYTVNEPSPFGICPTSTEIQQFRYDQKYNQHKGPIASVNHPFTLDREKAYKESFRYTFPFFCDRDEFLYDIFKVAPVLGCTGGPKGNPAPPGTVAVYQYIVCGRNPAAHTLLELTAQAQIPGPNGQIIKGPLTKVVLFGIGRAENHPVPNPIQSNTITLQLAP